VRKEINRHKEFFKLDHYRVVILKASATEPVAEATVKLHVGEVIEHRVAEGDGPVAALDGALRRALKPHYPAIDQVRLTDYKVRVINSKDEAAASVRVVVEFKRQSADGKPNLFGTTGVSTDVIHASWQALVDAYEYHLIHVEEEQAALQPALVGK
jgi:2-isopropylmalate synthase